MRHWSVLRNASEVCVKTQKTPYQFRFDEAFPYKLIPFGAECWFVPTSPKDIAKVNKFNETTLQGVVIGYKLKAGGKPTGEVYIVEKSELESADAAHEVY